MSNRVDSDIMQVCLSGHVINYKFVKKPEDNKDFCNRCGKKTITSCPNPKCDKPIRHSHNSLYGDISPVPSFCKHCGGAFPWTRRAEAKRLETEAKRLKEDTEKPLEALQRVFSKFHKIVRKLRDRYGDEKPLKVSNEYDVQYLLNALLVLWFDDVRREEPTPSFAGKSSRIDFLLKKEKIGVEVKMTRQGLADKEVRDQLIIDIESYKEHPDCNALICFIYDPEDWIANSTALIKDLQGQSRDDLEISVVIEPS